MNTRRSSGGSLRIRTITRGVLVVSLFIGLPSAAMAHEGHAALPSTGATMDGEKLLLSAAAREALGMQTAKVSLADLHDVLRLNAHVELPWKQHAMVTTLIPGRIAKVLVRPGEVVTAGQELARIESLELESLQLEMLQTGEEVKLGRRFLSQRQKLADQGVITGAKLLETQTDLRRKTARLQIAIRKLRAMGLDDDVIEQVRRSEAPVRSISLKAPIGGVVRHSVAHTGQFIQSSEQLFEIVDLSSLWIVGEVLENDAYRVAAGMPINVTFSGRNFTGEIAHVRLKMDQTQRTVGVVIPVDNTDGALRPGMFGRMVIEIGTAKDSIVCPVDALIETGNEIFALRRQGDGKYVRRPVKVGLRTRGQVEITSGLFPGDRVIVVGTQLLAAMFDSTAKKKSKPDRNDQDRQNATNKPLSVRSDDHETVVIQATVELPTHQKTFATSIIEGRISKILVDPGQKVNAGDVLAEIDSQQLRSLQLELLQANAKLKWTEETARRIRPLAEQGVTPAKDLWQIETDLKNSRQSVASLTRKLSLIGLSAKQIDRISNDDLTKPASDSIITTLPIRAPSDGRVAEFDLVLGQIVESHDRLFEIHDLSKVWAEGYVFEEDSSTLQVGQQVDVTFSARPSLQVKGTVVRLAPLLDSKERVLPVWIELETSERFLREGMLARAEIAVPKSNEPLASRAARE